MRDRDVYSHEKESSPDAQETLALIRQVQTGPGSQEACEMLRRQYAPLIRAAVAKYESYDLTMQEREDMREEAERLFLNALSSFDTTQEEVSFGLYARVCLHNGLVSEMRHLSYLRRLSPVSLNEAQSSEEESEDPADRMIQDERFTQLCTLVRSQLSDLENSIWWSYVAGAPVAQIAATLGKDERSVHNAIYRIRRKLRTKLSDLFDHGKNP